MRILALLLAVSACRLAWGQAPATFHGGIYHERSVLWPVRGPDTDWRHAFVLHPDGTFRVIFGRGDFTGRWSYRRDSANTATLTVGSLVRSLQFNDDSSGQWTAPQVTNRSSYFSLQSRSTQTSVANMSTLTFVRAGTVAACGFVVGQDGAWALIRAVGPSLSQFGVAGALSRPVLSVTRNIPPPGRGSVADLARSAPVQPPRPQVPTDTEIISQVGSAVGAFAVSQNSGDDSLLVVLPPGAYTAEVRSADVAAAGEVLVEVYFIP